VAEEARPAGREVKQCLTQRRKEDKRVLEELTSSCLLCVFAPLRETFFNLSSRFDAHAEGVRAVLDERVGPARADLIGLEFGHL